MKLCAKYVQKMQLFYEDGYLNAIYYYYECILRMNIIVTNKLHFDRPTRIPFAIFYLCICGNINKIIYRK